VSCCRSRQAKTKEKLQQQHVQSDFGAVVVVVVVVAMLLQQIAAASFVVDQDECFWNLLDPLPAASCTRISAPRYISAASVPSPSPFPSLPFPSLPSVLLVLTPAKTRKETRNPTEETGRGQSAACLGLLKVRKRFSGAYSAIILYGFFLICRNRRFLSVFCRFCPIFSSIIEGL